VACSPEPAAGTSHGHRFPSTRKCISPSFVSVEGEFPLGEAESAVRGLAGRLLHSLVDEYDADAMALGCYFGTLQQQGHRAFFGRSAVARSFGEQGKIRADSHGAYASYQGSFERGCGVKNLC
jgi:hypothetical protein